MNKRQASAPGKVVLSGEYAVLDGAPAVSMAVNRRAVVTVENAEASGEQKLSIRCTGLGGKTDMRLFERVRDVLSLDSWQGSLALDTSAFVDEASGEKIGIGSSAALCAALVRVLVPDNEPVTELAGVAQQAHFAFQNGVGSGVDVATSISGGLIDYRMGQLPRRLDWPDGLCYALLWSGVPVSTVDKLGRLKTSGRSPSRASLHDASGRLAAAWSGGDARAVLGEYRDYMEVVRKFDLDHDLGIFDAGHDVLFEESKSANVVYKPCGAGGGDIGIVLGSDPAAVRAFAESAASQGFRRLDMTIDPAGVSLHRGCA